MKKKFLQSQNTAFSSFFLILLLNVFLFGIVGTIIHLSISESKKISLQNQQMNQLVLELADFENVMDRLNSPGNDIFRSHNLLAEKNNMQRIQNDFSIAFEKFIQSKSLAPLRHYDAIQKTINQIQVLSPQLFALVDRIFQLYGKNQFTQAAEVMAQMDQAFLVLRQEISTLKYEILRQASELIHKQHFFSQNLADRVLSILFYNFILTVALFLAGFIAFRRARESHQKYTSQQEELNQFFDTSQDFFFVGDKDGFFTKVNSTFIDVLGFTYEELLRKPRIDFIHPDDITSVAAERKRLFENYRTLAFQNRLLKKDGSDVTISWSATLTSAGTIYAIGRDMTERLRLESELIQAKTDAESAALAKANFLANMSHEIRTPLNGVLAITEILAAEPLSPEIRQYVEVMKSSGVALQSLVNDILDFSKIDAGKLQLEKIPFDLKKLIVDLVPLFAAQAKEKEIFFKVSCSQEIPLLFNDVTRIRQVIINLLSNAIKFTSVGEVILKVTAIPLEVNFSQIQIEIQDTGIGLTESEQKNLFYSFSQADISTTRQFGGTGLGLAICKGICNALGGKISVQSKKDVGSTFTFSFPTEMATNNLSIISLKQFSDFPTPSRSLETLVADDHPTNRFVTQKLLEKLGHQVHLVTNGREALNAVLKKKYDVIFMDAQMPELDGFQATELIHKKLGKQNSPWIIAFSASATQRDIEKFRSAGMNDFLAKPLSLQSLSLALNRVGDRETFHLSTKSAIDNSEPQILNLAEIQKQFANDQQILFNVAQSFLETFPENLLKINTAFAQRDLKALASAAHLMRGACSYFQVSEIQTLLSKMETSAQENNFTNCEVIFEICIPKLKKLRQELSKLNGNKNVA